MARCDEPECKDNATRIVREEDPGSRLLRHLCSLHARAMVDTERMKRARPNPKMVIQRLPHEIGRRRR